MSWNVLITAPAIAETGTNATALLRDEGCKIFNAQAASPITSDALEKIVADHDAVLAGVDAFTAELLNSKSARRLKIISRWGVGVDSIDVAAATKLGIVVANTPGLLNEAVADYTFALLLSLARRIPSGTANVHAGNWTQSWGYDVHGQKLGLIGFGAIGEAVARRAAGFQLRVLAFDPHPKRDFAGVEFVSLDTLLAESDFVSLHASLTPQSRNLIGEAQLRKMKRTALLINAARGALVDETALVRALREGWIAGAALDVFCAEPLPTESPLRSAPNVLLTPHQASFARQTGERVSLAAARAIVDLMRGKHPQTVVNPEVFESPNFRATLCP